MARKEDNHVYVVNTDNKYQVSIEVIRNLEDAGDDFVSFEELAELMGVDEDSYINTGKQLRRELIKEQLIGLRQQAKEAGKKTILIRDADLVECLKTSGYAVSDFVEGMRRVGDRLFVEGGVQPEEKRLKKLQHQAFNMIIWRVQQTINKGNKFVLDLTYTNNDRHGALDFVKKIMTFEEIQFGTDSQEMVDLCRQIWDNIDNYFERKTEVVEEKVAE